MCLHLGCDLGTGEHGTHTQVNNDTHVQLSTQLTVLDAHMGEHGTNQYEARYSQRGTP